MHRAAGQPRQADVPRHQDFFRRRRDAGQAEPGGQFTLGRRPAGRERRVLRMLDDAEAEAAGIGQGTAHHTGVAHRALPVGKGHRPGFAQQADLRQLLPAAAAGDGPIGKDGEATGFLAPRAQQPHQRRVVDRRRAVRQGGQGGDAPGGGGLRGGGDGFPVFQPGLAQRGAHVHQAGAQHGAIAVDLGSPIRAAEIAAVVGDQPVADQQRAGAVQAAGRVEQADVGDQGVGHATCSPSPAGGRGSG